MNNRIPSLLAREFDARHRASAMPARILGALVFAGLAACGDSSPVVAPADVTQPTDTPAADASTDTKPSDVTQPTDKPATDVPPADVTPPADVPPADATPTDAPTGMGGDWGFRPMPDGFMFENYSNPAGTTNLTPVEVRRLLGPQVCEGAAATGTCTLTPQARQWMEQQNAGMNGGHCEGMAVTASLLYSGTLTTSAFGGTSTYGLAMPMNEALQREVALWFVTQITLPNEQRDQTPRDVVEQLERDFAGGRAFRGHVLGLYTSPGRGHGHAITPYAVRRPTPTTAEILAYDNNYPNQEKIVAVDLTANTFRYVTTTNPAESPQTYAGDAMTRTLNLAPIGPRLALPHVCTFCGDAEMMTGTAMRGSVQVALTGEGDIDIANAAGQHTGTGAGGAILNNIPGSTFASVRSGRDGDNPEPVYTVPREGTLTINLDGSRLSAAAMDSDLLITGQGFSLSVENVNLDPMQRDTITFRTDAPDIAYRASGSETPTLVLAFQRPGADYLVELRSSAFTTGQVLRLAVNFTTQTVRVSFDGSTSAPAFEYYMERVTDAGAVTTFRHAGVASTASSVLNFSYATWTGDGMPLSVAVDTNGDGTSDRTDMLSDEP